MNRVKMSAMLSSRQSRQGISDGLVKMCMVGGMMILFSAFAVSVQADCGEIIIPDNFNYSGNPEERYPIEDCINPFGETKQNDSSITPVLDGTALIDGGEIIVEALPVTITYDEERYGIPDPEWVGEVMVYHQVGNDYYRIPATPTDITFESVGTYVLVTKAYAEEDIVFVEDSTWWRSFSDFFATKVAHAQVPIFDEVYVTFFTISLPEPPHLGASSVLFLPGIQASRLYTDGAFGTENQLWEPNINADVEKLAMTPAGESINEIYTRDVLDEIYGTANIYKTLLKLLEEYQDEEIIKSYEAFAYDWRYDIFTVATEPVQYPAGETKELLEEVKRLAADSYTGKVTIIAHSNGGLVAKALLAAYGGNELDGLVDKLVMVGTPQLGTPKAIGALLHGIGQGSPLGFIISPSTAREVTKNMPGAYTLLPSDEYFAVTTDSVVTTDGKPTTQSVATYGDINMVTTLTDFLLDTNDQWPEDVSIHEPLVLNASILANTEALQLALNSFTAPDGVKVYEVVGTGLPTIRGFEYREFSCQQNLMCILPPFMKPVPLFSTEGDQTVMAVSASGYQGDKTVAYVDLLREGNQLLVFEKEHKDMTESPSILEFLTSVIKYPYLVDGLQIPQEFTSVATQYTIIAAHSPVSLLFEDGDGKKVGRVEGETRQEIIGSQYFELGSSKYVVVPSSDDYTVYVEGEEEGTYSLTIDELLADGTQENRQTIVGLPVTSGMRAQFAQQAGVLGPIVTDSDSNLVPDIEYNWDGSSTVLGQEVSSESAGGVERRVSGNRPKQTVVGSLSPAPLGNMVGASINQPRELNEYEKKLYFLLVQLQDILIKMYESNKE